jgi:2-polyprenyl-3-methyl-5-hydroxy-6-metoxy-1,4-benzoquinol methylase
MVRVARYLQQQGVAGRRLLDYGAYFGNFAAMFRDLGFEVDAVDAYRDYAPSLDPVVAMLGGRGIRVFDFAEVGRDLRLLPEAQYDVVLCMGVIEHVPHTARVLLEPLNRILKPGGLLCADTPNLVQLPNRQKIARGESVAPPIDIQYRAEIPFEGHHREYTVDEMVWMAQELGHEVVAVDLYNYSVYGQEVLHGRDASNHWRMIANPAMRELVMIVSRKPVPGTRPRQVGWQHVFAESEQYWRSRLPTTFGVEGESGILGAETLVSDLQAGVNERDRMLQQLQAEHQAQHDSFRDQLVARQAENAGLMDRLGALQFKYDMTPTERLKRVARKLLGRR